MFEIVDNSRIEILEKRSKFITRAFRSNDPDKIKRIIEDIVKKEKGAVHNCYAYRILDGNNIIEKKSDDGEPGGTAGAPMLSVLSGENIVNILAVTTRYFGGIKLGTGGLVRVYKKGVKEVLNVCRKVPFEIKKKWKMIFPINMVGRVDHFLKNNKIKITEKDFKEDVIYYIEVPDVIFEKLNDLTLKINAQLSEID